MRSLLLSTNVLAPCRILRPFVLRANASTKASLSGNKAKGQNDQVLTEDSSPEQIAIATKMQLMAEQNKLNFDVYAIPPPLLDLRVPGPVFERGATLQQTWRNLENNLANSISNTVSMFRIARHHSFPWNPRLSPWSTQIFKTASTQPESWLAPLREIALDRYKVLNDAVASHKSNVIGLYAAGTYKERLLQRAKALQRSKPSKSTRITWKLHSLASPVQCVSIRSQQGHMGTQELTLGTKYFVQACIKFDTWQSISVDSASATSEPKRVVEYLVFEKRMWYDEPWTVRDQLWPGPRKST